MRKKTHIPIIALVGYTNAGKSTLLNQLTHSNVLVADKLFATLDPITRRLEFPGGNITLITDTVGFIQKLPTQLIAAFRATLEEISEADLLLHIVDVSHPAAIAQWKSVQSTLVEIDCGQIPIITILNKMDRTIDIQKIGQSIPEWTNAISISAMTGQGIDGLLHRISQELFETLVPIYVKLPYTQGQLISLFHQSGQIEKIEHEVGDVRIKGNIPGRLVSKFIPFLINKKS
jgi:GTP-binding protein HflX